MATDKQEDDYEEKVCINVVDSGVDNQYRMSERITHFMNLKI